MKIIMLNKKNNIFFKKKTYINNHPTLQIDDVDTKRSTA